MPKKRLVFFGTSSFAVPTLQQLSDSGSYDIVGVVTSPDKPVGRNQEIQAPPVKQLATKLGFAVFQPKKLKDFFNDYQALGADVGVVVSYGKIIPGTFIHALPLGIINVHASLLPRHRGASPIQAAILHQDASTGVSIMLIDEGMDTGPVLASQEVKLTGHETSEKLFPALAELGSRLLVQTLGQYVAGEVRPQAQDDTKATHAGIIKKEDGLLDCEKSAAELEAQVRAYTPWPGSFVYFEGKTLKIIEAKIAPTPPLNTPLEPGILVSEGSSLFLVTSDGFLEIITLQLEGKQKQGAKDFINGHHDNFPIKINDTKSR